MVSLEVGCNQRGAAAVKYAATAEQGVSSGSF
jgi:hypothetical protein